MHVDMAFKEKGKILEARDTERERKMGYWGCCHLHHQTKTTTLQRAGLLLETLTFNSMLHLQVY